MRSRARLIVLSALILLVVAGSVLSWALENNVIETTSTNQVEVRYSEGACEQPGVTIIIDFGVYAERDPILFVAQLTLLATVGKFFKQRQLMFQGQASTQLVSPVALKTSRLVLSRTA